jgi:hypothetical protein
MESDDNLSDQQVETQQYAMLQVETAAAFRKRLSEFEETCKTDQSVLQNLKGGIAQVDGIRRARG